MGDGHLPRGEWVALAVALVWSAGFIVAAALAPAYQSTTETSSGTVTHGSATLVDENGRGVLLPVGVPLLVTVIGAAHFGVAKRVAERGQSPGPSQGCLLASTWSRCFPSDRSCCPSRRLSSLRAPCAKPEGMAKPAVLPCRPDIARSQNNGSGTQAGRIELIAAWSGRSLRQ
jgi:hypothetical protein